MDKVINEVLVKIHEGMDVFDNTGKKVGTVRQVHMGDEDPGTPEPETISDQEAPLKKDSFLEDLAEVFTSERRLPVELAKRLRRYGYVRIDAGLLHSDRLAANDQIAGVGNRSVTLNVGEDALIKI